MLQGIKQEVARLWYRANHKRLGRKILSLTLAFGLMGSLAACQSGDKKEESSQTSSSGVSVESQASESSESLASSEKESSSSEKMTQNQYDSPFSGLRLAALKGPTSMGLLKFVQETGEKRGVKFSMKTLPEEMAQALLKNEVDIACLPANLAAVLYNKSKGGLRVLGITNEQVLELVENGESMLEPKDLKGKTIYTTGQGATPQACLEAFLKKLGIDPKTDVKIQYFPEAAEAGKNLLAKEGAVGFLPQPFATAVQVQSKGLVRVPFSFKDAWEKAFAGKVHIVTGIMVATADFPVEGDILKAWAKQMSQSFTWTNMHPKEAAEMIEEAGIVKAPIAEQAIPHCDIHWLDESASPSLEQRLRSYYEFLQKENPKLIGGQLPGDDFYSYVNPQSKDDASSAK